jgi:hypothetical protein
MARAKPYHFCSETRRTRKDGPSPPDSARDTRSRFLAGLAARLGMTASWESWQNLVKSLEVGFLDQVVDSLGEINWLICPIYPMQYDIMGI